MSSHEEILLTMMARLESKVDTIDEKLDAYSPRLAIVEHRVEKLEETAQARGKRTWDVKLALLGAAFGSIGVAALAVIGLG